LNIRNSWKKIGLEAVYLDASRFMEEKEDILGYVFRDAKVEMRRHNDWIDG
jgi:hypothetical protein